MELIKNGIRLFSELTSNRILELIIMPTENCNFRCIYCYEDFSIGRMSVETIEGIKKLLNYRAPNLNLIYIQWFGGEPLVASDIVLEISKYVQFLCEIYPELKFKSNITTNGYLLNEKMFHKLMSVGITDYQISLDGPKEIHDLTRITAGKKGTFDKIWANLKMMRVSDLDFSVTLRIHFKKDTVESIKKLIFDIKEEFGSDSRFVVFFKAIAHLGGPNDGEVEIVKGQQQDIIIKEFKTLLYGDDYKENMNDKHICYAARSNSLIIRADSTVAKCTVALYDKRNSVGFLKPDGTLSINQEYMGLWLRGIKTLDEEVLSCPLQGLPSK